MNDLRAAVLPIDRYWAIDEGFAFSALDVLEGTDLEAHRAEFEARRSEEDQKPYEMVGGTAVVEMAGPMTKRPTSMSDWFGGVSTILTRKALRVAANDPNVSQILLLIDSPGGQVSGTSDLAADVAAINQQKPVIAYAQDMCCSAALWVGSQAGRFYANQTATVGSIGVVAVMYDRSEQFAAAGIKTLVISTGKYKGAGAAGAEVTDEQLKEFQREVNSLRDEFVGGLAAGRKMSVKDVMDLATGQVWIGEEAVKAGLIDAIAPLESVMSAMGTTPTRAQAGEEEKQMPTLWDKFKSALGSVEDDTPEMLKGEALKPLKAEMSDEDRKRVDGMQSKMEAQSEEIAELKASLKLREKSTQCAQDHAKIDGLVRQFKMTPAEGDEWKKIASDTPSAFAAASPTLDKRTAIPAVKGIEFKQGPGVDLDSMVKAKMAEKNLSYDKAAALVIRENPELARQHENDVAVVKAGGA